MKVILLNGSPHKYGCTYTALLETAKALNANDIETEILQIGTGSIHGCIACNGCSGKDRCVFEDDIVNTVIEKMEHADGLIVGTPVYYASPNGTILALLDRIFHAGNCFAYKPAAAIASARRAGTTCSLDVIHKYFTISKMPVVSSQYWPMVHGSTASDVASDEEGLQTMRVLGANMAWMLKSIDAGKKAGVEIPVAEPRIFTNFIR